MVEVDAIVDAVPENLAGNVEFLITILQALGGVLIIYVIFNIINTIINRKRNKDIEKVKNDVERINDNLVKIQSLLKKNKKK